MFSFNQPNCITALPRPEKARRRIQNDGEESHKRGRDGLSATRRGGGGGLGPGAAAAVRHSQCPTEIFGGACRSVCIIDCPTSSSPSIRGSGSECKSRVRPGTDKVCRRTTSSLVTNARATFRASAAPRAARPPTHPLMFPITKQRLPPSLAPLPPSTPITTFPTSSFPSLTPFLPPPLDKSYLFKEAHAESSAKRFLVIGHRSSPSPKWKRTRARTSRDCASASCAVVITSRRISPVPRSTRVTGILILIGGLQWDVSFHLGSGAAVVAPKDYGPLLHVGHSSTDR